MNTTSTPSMLVSPLSCLTVCTGQSFSQSSSALSSPLLGQSKRAHMRDSSDRMLGCLSYPSSSPSSSFSPSSSQILKSPISSFPNQSSDSAVTSNLQLPHPPRKCKDKGEKMMVMKCQRLTAEKTYEEIDIEVPVLIFNRMVKQNGTTNTGEEEMEKTFSKRIKDIFVR
eukprot:GFUD01040221.1.p1 GENE.GFUD01040221.1~~GFUD01040221.1.p1  ORF type:complete len:169 (-),score=51.82 GFUD01040221.1:53-559(-)